MPIVRPAAEIEPWPDLAVTDGLTGREIETQSEPRHGSNLTDLRGVRTGRRLKPSDCLAC
jgi:hypothetical protein